RSSSGCSDHAAHLLLLGLRLARHAIRSWRPMTAKKIKADRRQRRGAPWTDEEDERLLRAADLPPRIIAELMRRSWHACRRRLVYLRANGRIGRPTEVR